MKGKQMISCTECALTQAMQPCEACSNYAVQKMLKETKMKDQPRQAFNIACKSTGADTSL